MDFYQINDLERLSGVKSHTIRIWEKRYGLISPHRTETNIRYYDDEQLKKILNVASLSNAGLKISKIAAMSHDELHSQIRDAHTQSSVKFDFYVNDFISAMLDFNEMMFHQLFEEIVQKFGIKSAIQDVVYPFLYKTGVLWRIDETMPVQEHFATTMIKKKLFSLLDNSNFTPNKKSKKFILFLPSNEWHEIGLLYAEYIIRSEGHQSINLGQNVPFIDIEYVIQKTKPDYLLTFLISDIHQDQMEKLQQLLSSSYKNIECLISGNHYKLEQLTKKKNLKILKTPEEIHQFL